jgi:hypothetical protein
MVLKLSYAFVEFLCQPVETGIRYLKSIKRTDARLNVSALQQSRHPISIYVYAISKHSWGKCELGASVLQELLQLTGWPCFWR